MFPLADFAAVAFPTFSISLEESTGGRPADEDGVTAVALIRSLLPCVRPFASTLSLHPPATDDTISGHCTRISASTKSD